MRCFFALDAGSEVLREIENILDSLRKMGSGIKVVEGKNLHFTLKFLGEMNESEVEAMITSLREVERVPAFTLELKGMGYFGQKDRIRNVWLDVGKGKEQINELHEMIEKNTLGTNDTRFYPHLTLCRLKSQENAEKTLAFIHENECVKIGEMKAREKRAHTRWSRIF